MKLSDRELVTILAALRTWQGNVPVEDIVDPDYFESTAPLSQDEIDTLCERLNTSPIVEVTRLL